MANLNVKSGKEARVSQYAPGVFTVGAKNITVTTQAAVDALIAKGWARTADA